SFLEEKKRAEQPLSVTDKTDKSSCVSSVSESQKISRWYFASNQFREVAEARQTEGNCHAERDRPSPMPLRPCAALMGRKCPPHSPSPHRDECQASGFAACRSRWFWRSPYGAIKCVACAAPADLRSVEAWVLARETGEGDDGFRIPSEILKLL